MNGTHKKHSEVRRRAHSDMLRTKRKSEAPLLTEERDANGVRTKRRPPVRIPKEVQYAKPFFVVWTEGSERVDPVCIARSHAEAQRMVEALRAELKDYVAAGGSLRGEERSIEYFYSNHKGYVFEWDADAAIARRVRFHEDSFDEFNSQERLASDELFGRQLRVEVNAHIYSEPLENGEVRQMVLWGDMDSSSMAFAATEDGGIIYARFWRAIRARPYAMIETLRAIYTGGRAYDTIPSVADIEAAELEHHRLYEDDDSKSDQQAEREEEPSRPGSSSNTNDGVADGTDE